MPECIGRGVAAGCSRCIKAGCGRSVKGHIVWDVVAGCSRDAVVMLCGVLRLVAVEMLWLHRVGCCDWLQ